jgi:hypothetical protein
MRRAPGADLELTERLEGALVRELRAAWHHLNDAYFRGGLAPPSLELVEARATLGRWVPKSRALEISRSLVVEQPWAVTLEVLKHEMAHQYVHEVLGETSETPHGRAFRDACARLGIDGRASGLPAAAPASEEKMVERIARLLALAESPNRHEAESAMAAAQRLMLRHNIETDRAHAVRDYRFAHLGRPSGRVSEHERLVAMILTKHFFVEVIWIPVYRALEGRRGSVLEICGTRANTAIAEYVHGFLLETGHRLWLEHKRREGISSNRERRSFLAGVMTGFADKLDRQAAKSHSEGLVWVRDGDLAAYFRRRHPYVRSVRYAGQRRTQAWARGREAGRSIVLHKPVSSAATSRGKLLL